MGVARFPVGFVTGLALSVSAVAVRLRCKARCAGARTDPEGGCLGSVRRRAFGHLDPPHRLIASRSAPPRLQLAIDDRLALQPVPLAQAHGNPDGSLPHDRSPAHPRWNTGPTSRLRRTFELGQKRTF
jgi:hypothetical protein